MVSRRRVMAKCGSPAILQHIAHLLKPGGTAATFTAAGQVRRDLQSAGLTVHKRPGFGRKREMLCAEQATSYSTTGLNTLGTAPSDTAN